VDVEHCFPTCFVGKPDDDLAIEPTWPHQRGIEHVRPVGGGHDDHFLVRLEPVHLH
jgi:hypothetical protein